MKPFRFLLLALLCSASWLRAAPTQVGTGTFSAGTQSFLCKIWVADGAVPGAAAAGMYATVTTTGTASAGWTTGFGVYVNNEFMWEGMSNPTNGSTWTSSNRSVAVGGTYSIKFSYYDGSVNHENVAEVSGSNSVPAADKQLTFIIPANTSENPVHWIVVRNDSGAIVGSRLQDPGVAEYELTVQNLPSSATNTDYTLKFWLPGLAFNAGTGIWVSVNPTGSSTTLPTNETVFTSTATIAPTQVVEEGTSPTTAQKVAVPTPTNVPTTNATTSTTGGAVWRSVPLGSGGLQDATYMEGVDKIIASQTAIYNQQKGAFGSFDGAKSADTAARTKGYGGGSGGGAGTGEGAKASAESAGSSAFPSGSLSSLGGPSSGNSTPMTLHTSLFGDINFDPGANPRVSSVMTWIKAFLAWVIAGFYAFWVFNHFRELTAVGAVPQLRGHDIALGAGGAASALGNAVIWTTIILSLPVAFTAAMASAGLSMPGLTFLTSSPLPDLDGLGDFGSIAAKLIGYMIPWPTLSLALIGPIIISAFSIPIYLGIQAAIRWLIA